MSDERSETSSEASLMVCKSRVFCLEEHHNAQGVQSFGIGCREAPCGAEHGLQFSKVGEYAATTVTGISTRIWFLLLVESRRGMN